MPIEMVLTSQIPTLALATRENVANAVETTAREITSRAKVAVQTGAKTGHIYKRGNVLHQASAPGEAPATDVGFLANTIAAQRETDLSWRVDVGAWYGAHLEFGTAHIAPRPFLGPAVSESQEGHDARMSVVFAQRVESTLSTEGLDLESAPDTGEFFI